MTTTPVERAETAGEAVGRAYARTTAALVAPIRRAPAPEWPRERVLARVTAGRRRVRNVPRRLLNGLRVLLTRKRADGTRLFKAQRRPAKTRMGQAVGAGFVAWWGWSWAAETGVLTWVYSGLTAAVAGLAYALGPEPTTPARPLFRKRRTDPDDTAPEEAADDTPNEVDQIPEIDPLLALTAQLIGDARGVHLDALCASLNEAAPNRVRTPSEVRAALAQRGVFTRPSVRAPEGAVPGAAGKVRRGVHREDLEAVIGPLPGPISMEPTHDAASPATPAVTCDVAENATPVVDDVAGPVAAPVDMRKSA